MLGHGKKQFSCNALFSYIRNAYLYKYWDIIAFFWGGLKFRPQKN